MSRRAAVLGASGYSGLELTKILAGHSAVHLAALGSERWAGQPVGDHMPLAGPAAERRYLAPEAALDEAMGCDVVFLATPAETSLDWVPRLVEKRVPLVVDLSGAFRLKDPALYPRFYGFAHGRPDLLARAVYGLPELFRDEVQSARLVANPGCYPTASALALAPLWVAGLCAPPFVVDAKSGVTGAGRKATWDLSYVEVAGDFRAYRVLEHQHGPEIAQTLSLFGKARVDLTFTAHLLPVRRGIFATAYARLVPAADPAAVEGVVRRFWKDAPFVRVVEPEAVTLKAVNGTNRCLVAARADSETRMVVAFAAIDNLVKGAAGQAVQNMNLALGLDEALGLTDLKGAYP